MSSAQTTTHDVYQQVTNDIICDLEAGHLPWEKPWSGGLAFPRNVDSQNDYQGINVLILWCQQRRKHYPSAQWVTYKQAQGLGAQVKLGEKATSVIYYKTIEVSDATDTGDTETRHIPMLRTHAVFNLDQCEGLEKLIDIENRPTESVSEPVVCAQAESLMQASGAAIHFDGATRAYYDSQGDAIHLPARTQFKDQLGYYGTALHELTHWTGHTSRLGREFTASFGDEKYAKEELVAELGSSFLCAKVGLSYSTQHAAYIESWLKVLRNDKKAIFQAAARAREACEFLTVKLNP